MPDVYLFLTDKCTCVQTEVFAGIRDSLAGGDRAFILFHQKAPGDIIGIDRNSLYVFTNETLLALNYTPITMAVIPGSNHFPVLQFFLDFPGYSNYWVIEDDVRFTGQWNFLFDHFKRYDHDFISSHLRRFREEPAWSWWRSLSHHTGTIRMENRIRSFNPIYRISGTALAYVHRALSEKWIGHHEVLLPTLLYHQGFRLLDFGGEGEFVADGGQNLFYTSDRGNHSGNLSTGTMRYRPVWEAAGHTINRLYHPVKILQDH